LEQENNESAENSDDKLNDNSE